MITIIMLFLLILLSVITLLFVFIRKNQKSEFSKVGILLLKIDIKEWRLKKMPLIWNENLDKNQVDRNIRNIIDSGWIRIDDFFKLLDENQINKLKYTMQFCVQNQTNSKISMIFNINEKSRKKSYWEIDFIYINRNSLQANVRWTNKIETSLNFKMIDKNSLLKDDNEYKLFIAFNLNDGDKKNIQNFIYKINFLLKFKKQVIDFFIIQNIVIFVFKSKTFNDILKWKTKFIEKIFEDKNEFTINSYYNALTYVEVKNIKNENDFAKTITRISFGLAKSRLLNTPFYFNLKDVIFEEFEEYKKTMSNLNKILKLKKFEINKIQIKTLSSNIKKMNYLFPKYDIEFNNWLPLIKEFLNFDKKINSLILEKAVKEFSNEKKYLLNISDFDIENQFINIKKNSNIIYIINVSNYKKPSETINLLNLLKKHNIKIGLKIDKFNSDVLSIIENGRPEILILNKNFNNILDNGLIYSNITKIHLILLCERLSITPIFENIEDRIITSINKIGKKEKYFYQTSEEI